MAEKNFVQVGYNKDGAFIGTPLRAQDIFATDGTSAEAHITNAAIHITSDQAGLIAGAIQSSQKGAANGVAPLGADGLVAASYLPSQALTAADQNVADIAALTALSATVAPIGNNVFVGDATGDTTVTSGWAMYRRVATAGGTLDDWTKIAEGEGLDVAMIDQTARDAAATAQTAAENAQITANLIDAAYCTDETDMSSKNLRSGALVLMAVSNDPV